MVDWRKLIPGCFGEIDLFFAIHPLEQERAQCMLNVAIFSGENIENILIEIEIFLRIRGASTKHIQSQLRAVENCKFNFLNKTKLSSAWLSTWEETIQSCESIVQSSGNRDKIIFIDNGSISPEKIKDKIENYYIQQKSPLIARIAYARRKNTDRMIYNANFLRTHGYPYTAKIVCGNKPFIYARIVRNLEIIYDDEDKELIKWEEHPIPKPKFKI